MSLNNYKPKNISLSQIEVHPLYSSVITIDDLNSAKTTHEESELLANNFINQVSVYQNYDSFFLISGLATYLAFKKSEVSSLKVRVLLDASKQEIQFAVLYDILSQIRMMSSKAKKLKTLKNQFYQFLLANKSIANSFTILDKNLTCFSKILNYFDNSYRSSFFYDKSDKATKTEFKLSAKWFEFDADTICFKIADSKLSGLCAQKNGYIQKLIYEDKHNGTYAAKANYSSEGPLFTFRIIQSTAFLANIDTSLIYFNIAESIAEKFSLSDNGIIKTKLGVMDRNRGGYYLTDNNIYKYTIENIENKFIIKNQNNNAISKMKKIQIIALPVW